MGDAKRRTYTAAFKATMGMESMRGVRTFNEIGQEHGVHPAQMGQWKREIQEQAETLFEKNARIQASGWSGRGGSPVWGDRADKGETGLAKKSPGMSLRPPRAPGSSVTRSWR